MPCKGICIHHKASRGYATESKTKETLTSSTEGDKEESNEPNYNEDKDQLEEQQGEEAREMTINQVF
jgi:hypothetical protein